MSAPLNVHATGIMLGEAGVLIRGPSGAGKSLLALALLADAADRGQTSLLVADDLLVLKREGPNLMMLSPGRLEGRIELWGRGIENWPSAGAGIVQLAVDLVDDKQRMPEASEFSTEILGVAIARCPVPQRRLADGLHQMLLVQAALRALSPAHRTQGPKTT